MRLDRREAALEVGAFVPGKPEESELVKRIFATDDDMMPPADSNRALTAAQKETLKRWIAEGAEYQAHWAFIPPVRPEAPVANAEARGRGETETRRKGDAGKGNPVDAFVGAVLRREGLEAAKEADRRTLIRRLSFDLTGLPPTPDDVEAFVGSRDPQAYEKLVQRYLASPHFGERMALPWLDLVRYADTIGFHNDVPIRVWPYRDYVINAFNTNLPFDQFVREQLAGDLLPDSTIQQRVASGYNRLHRISGEGGIQDKEYYAKYAADRARTTATAFMGVTMACAECHDHKFDPLTIKDFYSFEAIFADLNEKGAYNIYGGFTRENLSEEMIFASPQQKQQIETFDAAIARLKNEVAAVKDDALAAGREAWETRMLELADAKQLEWRTQRPLEAKSLHGATLTIDDENAVVAGGPNPVNDTYEVTIPAPLENVTAVRIEPMSDPKFPGDDVSRSGSTYFISEIEVLEVGADGAERALRVAGSRAAGATELGYPASAATDGDPKTAVSFVRKRGGGIALDLAEPWHGGPEARLRVRIRHSDAHRFQNLGRFRVSLHELARPDPNPSGLPEPVLKALRVTPEKRKAADKKELVNYYRTVAPELAELSEKLRVTTETREYLAREIPSMPVSKSVAPRKLRVLARGNWMDDSGDEVTAAIPAYFGKLTPRNGERVSRLDFAEWLVAPENPLTARVFVNRLWRQFFGAGLVATLEDMGSQGAWPTHPELLDWLAVEFRESGWDVKRMVALIVTSKTYRQSAQAASRAVEERDPTNKFLARQTRFRLEAELVRDNALAIAGLLVPKIGGPSVKPYQPEGYYAPLNFPRREYVPDMGEGLYRRGIYTHWQRTFLHPSLMAFDAPAREECTANRMPSNTPVQALVLLNDPTFVEAARVFAEKIVREGGVNGGRKEVKWEQKLAWAYGRALGRAPSKEEGRALHGLFEKQWARYAKDEAAARELVSVGEAPVAKDVPVAELAAWTAVARAILNLHETITRN